MKFLCDNCKAKYQIADDKVAGKTVRMKCRKCGHLIEVKAEVTETSVAKSFPPPPDAGEQTVIAPMADLRAPAAPQATKLGTSLSSARPAPRSPSVHPKGDALADAFHKNVDRADRSEGSASRSLRELAASDEWYVAINGVPVGPIRMAELRRKAAMAAVTEESLCWQEGLEEWRPVRTFPELLAAVQEAVAAGRPSLTPAPGDARSGPIGAQRPVPSAPVRPSYGGAPQAPSAKPLTPAARSNVVPITSRLATAERLDEAPLVEPVAPMTATTDPFATSAPAPLAAPLAAPFAAPMATALAPPPVLAVDAQKKAPPWIPIAMVVLAAAFGVTAAYAIFFRPAQSAPAPVVILSGAMPAATTAPTAAPTTPDTAQTVEDVPVVGSSSARPTGTGGKVAAATTTTASTKVMDPEIAKLLGGGPGGPAVGPGAGGGGGGSSLTSDQIEAVVRNHQTGVKRTCWERSGSQSAAVNVKVHVVVGPTGSVQSANAEGNDPIVTKCIETSVRGWQFPPTGATTNVDIPFHFLRQ